MRTFESGATRDQNADKLDYYRFFSPRVLRRFAEYMHQHRKQADGSMRDGDNWKKGIPIEAYRESLNRHFHEYFQLLEVAPVPLNHTAQHDTLCAILFNVMGILFEETKPAREGRLGDLLPIEPLKKAAIALYEVGPWEAEGVSNADDLWAALRDALRLPEGTATTKGVAPLYVCAEPFCVNRVLHPGFVCGECMANAHGGSK